MKQNLEGISEQIAVVRQFETRLVELSKPSNCLYITREGPQKEIDSREEAKLPAFFTNSSSCQVEGYPWKPDEISAFDLIFADLPLGLREDTAMQSSKSEPPLFPRHMADINLVCKYAMQLSTEGYGFFVLLDRGLNTKVGERVISGLEKNGLFLRSIIQLPKGIYEPLSQVTPALWLIRKVPGATSVSMLENTKHANDLAKFILGYESDLQHSENFKDPKEFPGFRILQVRKQIARLQSRYNEYESRTIDSLVDSVERETTDLEGPESDNVIYIQNGSLRCHLRRDDLPKSKSKSYVQLTLKPEVLNTYLINFFGSEMGRLTLQSACHNSILPTINYENLLKCPVPVPPRHVQERIVETHSRFIKLEKNIASIRQELSLNPESLDSLHMIDSILEATENLTAGDQLKSMILKGESKKLEFKQTFQLCIRTKDRQPYVEDSALKTIAGFLNSEGGTLLIGVEDSGQIPGIDEERKKFHKQSNDKYLLLMKDKLAKRLGSSVFAYIDFEPIEVSNRTVMKVDCQPSNQEVFLDEKDFYIRTSPSTDKLEGRELSTYLRTRFA